jgi:lysophospholipid acyltransferase (LPLAT)-like uncharacterized protein
MKLRHPALIKAAGLAGSLILRLWMGTLRYRYRPLGPNVDPHETNLDGSHIYAIWHENMLLPAYRYARPDISILISEHADGQLIAEVCRHLRIGLVRGSTSRGGASAVRQMLRANQQAHLAITPDGPRGPRRHVQLGLIYVAARTRRSIIPTGFGFHRPWRLRSWDMFALPRPWSNSVCVTAAPMCVPADAGREELEEYRQRVEEALNLVSALAERRANPEPQTQTTRENNQLRRGWSHVECVL